MAQQLQVIDPSVPSGDTGTTLAQKLNDWRATLLSMNSGTGRPSYVQAGTLWRDTTESPWQIKLYDGSDDIVMFEVDPTTHLVTKIGFTPATAEQILAGILVGAPIDPAGLQSRVGSVAQYRARVAGYLLAGKTAVDALAEITITDAVTIVPNLNLLINGAVTLGADRIMGLPTNGADGMSGRIRIIQGSGGNKLLTWATGWQFSGGITPVLSTAAGAVDNLYYDVLPSGDVFGSLVNDVKRPS